MKDGRINLRIGSLHAEWEAACLARGETPAQGALRLIKQELAASQTSQGTFLPTSGPANSGHEEKKQIKFGRKRFRFSESEITAMEAQAQRLGFHNTQAWVIAAVRGALTQAPQFSQKELRQLSDSTRAVGAVGRNLNQLVRAINTSAPELAKVTPQDIEAIRAVIDTEVRNLRAVVLASAERWPLVASP